MFGYEGILFYKAQSSLSLASTNINKANSLHSKLLAFPVGFEYKNEISDVVGNVKLITTNIAKLVRKASETKDLLCKNDAEFASGYYQSALSNYSGKETLNDSDEGFVNYYSSKYDEYLFKCLDEMNSQGNLPEEYRETYNQLKLKLEIKEYEKELEVLDKDSKKYKTKLSELNKKQEELNDMYISQLESKDNLTTEEQEILKKLKDSKSLNAKQAELEKLKKNIPVNPGNPNGRITEQQGKDYVAAKKKYDDYMAKINKLEDEIEGLQKKLGVYENKWYEDIGEAFIKTGSAWKKAFKTKDLDDFKSAAKQTGATGAVIYRSAKSGILKIDELVVDGVVGAVGSVVSGLVWLGDHDAGKNLMDGTLDFIKRDLVGELNQNFYENNPIGKWINENSNLKYDSAGAKAIQKASKFVVEVAVATAAEIGTFGAATPLVTAMFMLEGAGEAAESYTQSVRRDSGESYNYAIALGSGVFGAFSGAMKGKMYGKIGANTFNILKDPSLIKSGITLLKETGAKKILTNELKSTSFWFDFLTTGGQKAGEVVNEYHKTGDINWGKAFTSFAGELLYARFTDKLTANSIDDIINQKTVFQTVKDISSKVKNISRKAGNVGNKIISEVDLDDPVIFNNYMDSLTPEERTKFMTDYYSSMYGEAFEGRFSGPISYVDPKAKEFNKNLLLTKAHEISGWIDITEPRALIWTVDSSNGKLKVDVDWPKYGGMKLKSIMGLDNIEGDIIRLDRFGSQGGGTYALVPSNGKPYSLSERAIFNNLNSSNPNVSGYRQIEFNKTKYMDFCDGADNIVSYCNANSIDFSMASFNVEVQKKIQDLTTKLGLELNSENISKVDAAIFGERGSYISDLALKDGSYYNGTGVKSGAWRDDIVGVEEATGISRKYGYVGEAAPWITPDGEIIAGGGAVQLNLRTSEATLNSLGIMKSSDNFVFNN